jgi:hypothetical protein
VDFLQLGLGPVAVQRPGSDADSDDGGFGRAGGEIGPPWWTAGFPGCFADWVARVLFLSWRAGFFSLQGSYTF